MSNYYSFFRNKENLSEILHSIRIIPKDIDELYSYMPIAFKNINPDNYQNSNLCLVIFNFNDFGIPTVGRSYLEQSDTGCGYVGYIELHTVISDILSINRDEKIDNILC